MTFFIIVQPSFGGWKNVDASKWREVDCFSSGHAKFEINRVAAT